MIRLSLALGLSLLLPGQAIALSCMPADPVRDFVAARDAPDRYRVVFGALSMPKVTVKRDHSDVNNPQPNEITVKARLSGKQITRKGFQADFDETITVTAGCAAAWCADPPRSAKNALIFLRDDGKTMLLDLGPCPHNFYPSVSAKDVKRVELCAAGGDCSFKDF